MSASAVVNAEDVGLKLFVYCRKLFPKYSKRQLHNLFTQACIYLNGNQLTGGHDDESKRMCLGDVVSCNPNAVDDSSTVEMYQLLREGSDGIAVLLKHAGVASRIGSPFDIKVKQSLWNGHYAQSIQFLFRPSMSQVNMCIVARDEVILGLLRKQLCSGMLHLKMRMICTGFICEVGQSKYIECEATSAGYSVTVTRIARSRSANILSEIEVMPSFNSSCMCDCAPSLSAEAFDPVSTELGPLYDTSQVLTKIDTETKLACFHHHRCLQYPTLCIKQAPRLLARVGHPVVGDRGIVKSSKGLFSGLFRVEQVEADTSEFQAGSADNESISRPLRICIDIAPPPKFEKLLQREEAMCTKADASEAALIESLTAVEPRPYSALCSEDCIEQNADTSEGESESDVHELQSCGLKRARIIDRPNNADGDFFPIQYKLGFAEFCGFRFHVDNRVMIPRKSSEAVVSAVTDYATMASTQESRSSATLRPWSILDLGTGSGCLLLSVIALLQNGAKSSIGLSNVSPDIAVIRGVGVDISRHALDVATRNACAMNLDQYTTFVENSFDDLLPIQAQIIYQQEGMPSEDGIFDIVLCNPPYSSETELHRLSRSRIQFEPAQALFNAEGGPLASYRSLAKAIRNLTPQSECSADRLEGSKESLLKRNCRLFFEIGSGQESAVREIFASVEKLHFEKTIVDHKSIPRCIQYRYC